MSEELTEIEIDGLAVMETEYAEAPMPYRAYLIRKVLNILAPGWEKNHPWYKFVE